MHIEQELNIEIASRVREIMQRSVQMLKDISNQVTLFVRDARQSLTSQTIELVSPLVLDCIYSSTSNLSWMGIENGAPQYAIGKAVCEEMLHSLSARWKAASKFTATSPFINDVNNRLSITRCLLGAATSCRPGSRGACVMFLTVDKDWNRIDAKQKGRALMTIFLP